MELTEQGISEKMMHAKLTNALRKNGTLDLMKSQLRAKVLNELRSGGIVPAARSRSLLEEVSLLIVHELGTFTQSSSSQTDVDEGIDVKLRKIDEKFRDLIAAEQSNPLSIFEERRLQWQREAEERLRVEVEEAVSRVRRIELSKIKLEEQARFQALLSEMKADFENSYQKRVQEIQKRETEMIDRLERKRRDFEEQGYQQRQKMLADMGLLRQREMEWKRSVDLAKAALQVQEKRLADQQHEVELRARALDREAQDQTRKNELALSRLKADLHREYEEQQRAALKASSDLEVQSRQLDLSREAFNDALVESRLVREQNGVLRHEAELLKVQQAKLVRDLESSQEQNATRISECDALKMEISALKALIGNLEQLHNKEVACRVSSPNSQPPIVVPNLGVSNEIERLAAEKEIRNLNSELRRSKRQLEQLMQRFGLLEKERERYLSRIQELGIELDLAQKEVHERALDLKMSRQETADLKRLLEQTQELLAKNPVEEIQHVHFTRHQPLTVQKGRGSDLATSRATHQLLMDVRNDAAAYAARKNAVRGAEQPAVDAWDVEFQRALKVIKDLENEDRALKSSRDALISSYDGDRAHVPRSSLIHEVAGNPNFQVPMSCSRSATRIQKNEELQHRKSCDQAEVNLDEEAARYFFERSENEGQMFPSQQQQTIALANAGLMYTCIANVEPIPVLQSKVSVGYDAQTSQSHCSEIKSPFCGDSKNQAAACSIQLNSQSEDKGTKNSTVTEKQFQINEFNAEQSTHLGAQCVSQDSCDDGRELAANKSGHVNSFHRGDANQESSEGTEDPNRCHLNYGQHPGLVDVVKEEKFITNAHADIDDLMFKADENVKANMTNHAMDDSMPLTQAAGDKDSVRSIVEGSAERKIEICDFEGIVDAVCSNQTAEIDVASIRKPDVQESSSCSFKNIGAVFNSKVAIRNEHNEAQNQSFDSAEVDRENIMMSAVHGSSLRSFEELGTVSTEKICEFEPSMADKNYELDRAQNQSFEARAAIPSDLDTKQFSLAHGTSSANEAKPDCTNGSPQCNEFEDNCESKEFNLDRNLPDGSTVAELATGDPISSQNGSSRELDPSDCKNTIRGSDSLDRSVLATEHHQPDQVDGFGLKGRPQDQDGDENGPIISRQEFHGSINPAKETDGLSSSEHFKIQTESQVVISLDPRNCIGVPTSGNQDDLLLNDFEDSRSISVGQMSVVDIHNDFVKQNTEIGTRNNDIDPRNAIDQEENKVVQSGGHGDAAKFPDDEQESDDDFNSRNVELDSKAAEGSSLIFRAKEAVNVREYSQAQDLLRYARRLMFECGEDSCWATELVDVEKLLESRLRQEAVDAAHELLRLALEEVQKSPCSAAVLARARDFCQQAKKVMTQASLNDESQHSLSKEMSKVMERIEDAEQHDGREVKDTHVEKDVAQWYMQELMEADSDAPSSSPKQTAQDQVNADADSVHSFTFHSEVDDFDVGVAADSDDFF